MNRHRPLLLLFDAAKHTCSRSKEVGLCLGAQAGESCRKL